MSMPTAQLSADCSSLAPKTYYIPKEGGVVMKMRNIDDHLADLCDIARSLDVITEQILDEDLVGSLDGPRLEGFIVAIQGLQQWIVRLSENNFSISTCEVNSREDFLKNEVLVRLKLVNEQDYDQATIQSAVHGMLTFLKGPSLKFNDGKVERFPLENFEIIPG